MPVASNTNFHKEYLPLPNDCLADRATSLANAASKERHQIHLVLVQQISASMNARGVFDSSEHVNNVSKACASELRNIAGLLWENLKCAHESCGSKTPEKLLTLYWDLLQAEKTKMEAVVEGAVGGVAKNLQNQSMISMREVADEHEILVEKYKTEIAIYTNNLRRGVGATLMDRIRYRFLNNKVIAVAAIVFVAIGALAGFGEAIGKLINVAKSLLGNS